MGNAQLTIARNYSDGEFFTQAIVDAAFDSIEAFTDIVNANLEQLRADIFTGPYPYNDDGTANLVTPLETSVTTAINAAITGLTGRTAVDDVNATLALTDVILAYYNLTTTRTVTLPSVATVTVGRIYYIKDESGAASPTSSIVIDGSGAEEIEGNLTYSITRPYQCVAIYTDGTSWFTLEDVSEPVRSGVADVNYSIDADDKLVALTSLTATRTLTLPAANSVVVGAVLKIKDETGNASDTVSIVVDGNGAETIDGQTTVSITAPYGSVEIYSNGSAWFTV